MKVVPSSFCLQLALREVTELILQLDSDLCLCALAVRINKRVFWGYKKKEEKDRNAHSGTSDP